MFCSRDFMNRQRKYNNDTLEQLWMSTITDTHEMICQCDTPYAHVLSLMFPLGHTDRKKTIEEILFRDYKQRCQAGGYAGDGFGGEKEETTQPEDAAATTTTKERKPDVSDADLIDFLAENVTEEETKR